MLDGMTIAACSTPPGRSRLALVRLSGPEAFEAARSIGMTLSHNRSVQRTGVRVGDATLPVQALTSPGPGSYTGEDTVEIVIPGNPALIRLVIDALVSHGRVREAGPGEFTSRAFANGRLTLEQAEGVALAIASESESELTSARALLEGRTGARYRDWADRITLLLALIEAGTDFADQEDVTAIEPDDLRSRCGDLCEEMRRWGAEPRESRSGRPSVVMVGHPSAGKSTLFNALLGRRRAVTDPRPGTTRDALVEVLDLSLDAPGAGQIDLVDLPGIGPDPAERGRIAERARAADAIIVCDPAGVFAALGEIGLDEDSRFLVRVRTMADMPGRGFGERVPGLPVCALDGRNIVVLRRALADLAFGAGSGAASSVVAPRHARSLRRCADALVAAADASAVGDELVAQELRAALDAIGELVGRVDSDDVLARVFSSFCIGK